MKRREFITFVAAAAVFPRVALAQQTAKLPRIAVLSFVETPEFMEAIHRGLASGGPYLVDVRIDGSFKS